MKQLDLFTGKESDYAPKLTQRFSQFETPQDLELLLSRLTVVEVGLFYLGDKIRKKPRNPNYVGLCPFHQEKTPSFYLRPRSNRFMCYGCKEEGGPLLLDYKLGGAIYHNIAQITRIDAFFPSEEQFLDYAISNHLTAHDFGAEGVRAEFIRKLGIQIEKEYSSPYRPRQRRI